LALGLNTAGHNANVSSIQGHSNFGRNNSVNLNQFQDQNPANIDQSNLNLTSGNPLGGSSLPPRAEVVINQNNVMTDNNPGNQIGLNSEYR
jgi:hypothetical protein